MKKSIFTLFLLFGMVQLYAQDIPFNKESGKIEYTKTIEKPGSQEEVYQQIKSWVTRTFKSAEEIIIIDDPQTGQLSLRGQSLISLDPTSEQDTALVEVPVHFNLLFKVENDRYNYLVTDIYFDDQGLIIPLEETLLTRTQQERIIRDRLLESSIVEEAKDELVREGLERYRQFKSKGRSTLNGIVWLIEEGLGD